MSREDDDGLPTDQTVARTARAGPGALERFAAGQVLSDRYRIVARLGRGGMGEVYRADDLRLGQPVALKFLPANAWGDQRLIDLLTAEVRIGRQLSHPNVCRLYDLVEAGGQFFVAMEFVEGEDLGELLRKAGRLPADRVLRIMRDIANGLAAAHELGVIHRDLKPSNVMIDPRGRARIADFGLALTRAERGGGEVAGTPAYMAPEQLEGKPATARSDLYALGLIALEMLTGERLYDADTLDRIVDLHRRPKPRPTEAVNDLNPMFERAILQCVEEDPEQRPRSAHQLLSDLPAEIGARTTPRRDSAPDSERQSRSIAVLPFESLTPEPDDEMFAAGLAEEILSDLARLRSLRVISRASAMRFRGAEDLGAVARELQVRYVLTGSVRKRGEQLRITANLVDAQSDAIVWSEKFGGTAADLFDIQETVARAVATQLKGQLSDEENREISARPFSNPLAFEYYLKARSEVWRFTREGLDRAMDYLRRGIELVGENLLFHAALANVHWQYYNSGISADVTHLEKADELGQKILSIDPDSPHGYRVVGLVALSRGEVRKSLLHLRRAVTLDPNDTEALVWCCGLSCFAGLSDQALPIARRLKQIDPASSFSQLAELFVQWIQGRFAEAAETAAKGAELDPSNAAFVWGRGYMFLMDRRFDDAQKVAVEMQRDLPNAFFTRLLQLLLRGFQRDREAVLALLTPEIERPAWNDLQYSVHIAEVWLLLGERERALEWLGNAIARGFTDAAFLGTHDWLLEPLHDEPRFAELLQDARQRSESLRRELG
jgi:serine/threonine protein kinase